MIVVVMSILMVMARERRHSDHDHHDKKQWQQLFHGGDYKCKPRTVSSA